MYDHDPTESLLHAGNHDNLDRCTVSNVLTYTSPTIPQSDEARRPLPGLDTHELSRIPTMR
jgi:hypothetical protein